MITFDLECGNGHYFEGWFDSSDSFNIQKKQGLIICPYCDSNKINKRLSTFSVKKQSKNNVKHFENKVKSFIKENFDFFY